METIHRPFTLNWLEENRSLLLVIHEEELEEHELKELQACTSVYFRKARRKIHSVIDLRDMENPKRDVKGAMANIRPINDNKHGSTIIIVEPSNPLLKFTSGAAMRSLELPFYICHDMDEARAILASLE